jgi:hypothetical protein
LPTWNNNHRDYLEKYGEEIDFQKTTSNGKAKLKSEPNV